MRRTKYLKTKPQKEDMSLQITSMADIFTIILVFLLKSFSTGVSSISPSQDLTLPAGKAMDPVAESTKIEISSQGIMIDDKPVTQLTDFKFSNNDLEADGTPRSLNVAFISQMEKEKARSGTNVGAESRSPGSAVTEGPATAPHLMVLADQKTPYATLKTVLASAANTGFGEFKLVVVEDK